jgi:hypothetical protein
VSTKYLGGEKGGFQHKDFRRGRPDLLKEIGRTAVKRRVNHTASKASSSTLSQSAKHKAISNNSKTAVVATETKGTKGSCSSSTVSASPIHSSSATMVDVIVHANIMPTPAFLPNNYGLYFSEGNFVDPPRVLPAPPLTVQSLIDGPSTAYKAESKAESKRKHTIDNSMAYVVQPFSEDELIYLESIFHKDENHSDDNDLCSILSLDNDAYGGVFQL